MPQGFDAVIVGTGFASSFFLHRFLQRSEPGQRILVLEAGARRSHRQQLDAGVLDSRELLAEAGRHFVNRTPEKIWAFTVGFGGGSNCWWGNTPRMLPADFRLRSRYGVGSDWPFDYDALEPYYCDAEDIMGISGPDGPTPAPRSRPYPQPPHRMSEPDRRLARAFPDTFVHLATARARVATQRRAACCGGSVCRLCPIDAKFTIENELGGLYADPRVDLRLGARATGLERAAGRVTGVRYIQDGVEHVADADLVVLGANALFNAELLLASGLPEGGVGQGLVEQVARTVTFYLDGLENFQGSTSHTGHGFMFYDGEHRRRRAAALVETSNAPRLRHERGKWRQILEVKFVCEDLRLPTNAVTLPGGPGSRPEVRFTRRSDYAQAGLNHVEVDARRLAAELPVERMVVGPVHPGEAHIQGTTVMGADPLSSVVDADCVHHRMRNLVVLGSGAFPTASPANPTLTIAALSLRVADRLLAHRGAG